MKVITLFMLVIKKRRKQIFNKKLTVFFSCKKTIEKMIRKNSSFDVKEIKNSPDQASDVKQRMDGLGTFETSSNAIFTPKPIPKKFCFPEMDDYIVVVKPMIYEDSLFCIKKFVPQYLFCASLCDEIIGELETRKSKAQNKLAECFMRNLVPKTKNLVQANADFWRKQVILYKQKTVVEKLYNEKIVGQLRQAISIAEKIRRLANYLAKYPRYIMLNQPMICMLQQTGTDYVSPTALKIKALGVALSDTKIGLMFTPKLFERPDESQIILNNIINGTYTLIDPITGYIPETEYYYTFIAFLKSRLSPIRLNQNLKEPIENKIEFTIEMVSSFIGINDARRRSALSALSARFWFNRLMRVNIYYKSMRNPHLPILIQSFQKTKLKDLGMPDRLAKHMSKFNCAAEIFESNQRFFAAGIEGLETAIFLANPIDIANVVYLMNLVLSGYIANLLKKAIYHKDVVDCMPFMWTCLFIYLNLPAPDSLICFTMRWAVVDFIPEILVEKCKVPHSVILKWLEKCPQIPKKNAVTQNQ